MTRPRFALLAFAVCASLACSGGGKSGPASGGEGGETATGGATGTGGRAVRDAGGGGGTGGAGTGGAPAADAAARDTSMVEPDAAAAAPDTAPTVLGRPFVYVGASADPNLRIFEMDPATGALTPRGMAMANASPNYLAIHPTRRFLYVTSQVAAGRVVAFAVNGMGQLTRLNDAASGGAAPAHISLHKSGKWLFVANYEGGNASVLPVAEDGRLGAAVATVPAGAEAHMIVDDGQSGSFVFVPSKGSNRVYQFKFDAATGQLTPNTPPFLAEGGQPRHIAFHRGGKFAYLLTEGSRTVVAYSYDATTGLLSPLTKVVAGNDGFASHIAMHPTKDLFYAAVRGPDTITTFSVGADGRPTEVGKTSAELSYPWDFHVEATGSFLVAANNTSASIKVFRVAANGTLSLVGGVSVPAQTRAVRVVYPP